MKSCNTHLSWDVAALTVASRPARSRCMLEHPGLISPVIAGVAISPYGMLPVAPEVGTPPIPENRVGIAARPMSGLGPPRQAAFVAARSLTPRSGARLRPSLARRVLRCSHPAPSLCPSDAQMLDRDAGWIAYRKALGRRLCT